MTSSKGVFLFVSEIPSLTKYLLYHFSRVTISVEHLLKWFCRCVCLSARLWQLERSLKCSEQNWLLKILTKCGTFLNFIDLNKLKAIYMKTFRLCGIYGG